MRLIQQTASALAATAALTFGAAAAHAQDHDPEKWAKEFETKMHDRMAKKLGLTDEQKTKYLELQKESEAAMKKAQKELEAKLDAMLNEAQKKKYETLKKDPMGGFDLGDMGKELGGLGEQLGGILGGGTNPMRDAKSLAKELELDGEKTAALEAIYTKYTEESKGEGAGAVDWSDPQAAMKQMQEQRQKRADARKKRAERIRDLLRGETREKFDELEQKHGGGGLLQSFGLSLGGPDGPMVFGSSEGGPTVLPFGGGRNGTAGAGGSTLTSGSPEGAASPAVVKKDLQLSEEESMVLWPIVEKILTAQRDHANQRRVATRVLRRALKDGGEEGGLAPRLAALRDTDRAHRDALAGLRAELRDLVTMAQEAVLVGYGVLE